MPGLRARELLPGTVLGAGSWRRQLPVTKAQESRAGQGSREFHTRQSLTCHSHGNPSRAARREMKALIPSQAISDPRHARGSRLRVAGGTVTF